MTQYGAATSAPAVWKLPPPLTRRRWKATPRSGVTTIIACRELFATLSRIMTPALAHGSVFWTETTRATIVASPATG